MKPTSAVAGAPGVAAPPAGVFPGSLPGIESQTWRFTLQSMTASTVTVEDIFHLYLYTVYEMYIYARRHSIFGDMCSSNDE